MEPTQSQMEYCLECGVCTGSCPVSFEIPDFSPRRTIKRLLSDHPEEAFQKGEIWACLTCARCRVRCPAEIDFPEVARTLRERARRSGHLPRESHHGLFQTIAALQTGPVRQDRIRWTEPAGRVRNQGDVFLFVGCLPYFDIVFRNPAYSPLASAKAVLGLLNRLGIEPVISQQERCCGHDAWWSGDGETFRALAEKNLEIICSSGARTVLFACPECFSVFRDHYPTVFGTLPFEIVHLAEFLAGALPAASLAFQSGDEKTVTYQDPCRLGRIGHDFEHPRRLLKLIPKTRLVEMAHSRDNATCCGTSAWMECSACSKSIQVERLGEALNTGAQTLITACPKCQIHLTCAQRDLQSRLKVTDLYVFLFDHLCGRTGGEDDPQSAAAGAAGSVGQGNRPQTGD